jgi:hypothetical protein
MSVLFENGLLGRVSVINMGDFAGPVFRQGDGGYDAERAGFNLTVDHQPGLIVGATGGRRRGRGGLPASPVPS